MPARSSAPAWADTEGGHPMPVVINEIEVLEPPAPPPASGTPAAPAHTEPIHEQLRRLQRDYDARQRRLTAD